MNYCTIVTVLLFSVVGIVTVMIVAGCGAIPTSPKYYNSSASYVSLTPIERKVTWQKTKKWRSLHGQWIEDRK